jgi:SAM-dependent methyltransferase
MVRSSRSRVTPRETPRELPQRRAFSTMVGPVTTAGEPAEAEALGALFHVDPALERALTHGFHSYAGRLHPSIARRAIARWSPPGGVVMDPFCGSGTVLVEGLVAGRRATGIDASPLAVAIARVRSNPLDEASRAALVARARVIAEEAGELARKRKRPELPRWAAEEITRFHPHVALELFTLRELVMHAPEPEHVALALRLCFSSILVKFMASGPAAPRDGSAKRIARGLPSRFLADRAAELAAGLQELADRKVAGVPPVRVFLGDARSYPDIRNDSVDFILSSPPYAGVYDYAEHHSVRFRWLGLPMEEFRQRQLGERAIGSGVAATQWQEGRRRWLVEMGRVLRPGGAVALVVGDGVVGDRPEDAASAVAQDAQVAGLFFVASASQQRNTRDQRLKAIFGDRPRQEHIVLLAK